MNYFKKLVITISNLSSLLDSLPNISVPKAAEYVFTTLTEERENCARASISLEALALRSQNAFTDQLNKDIFRYKTVGDLFYDFNSAKWLRASPTITNGNKIEVLLVCKKIN
jgi:hypothetical protein